MAETIIIIGVVIVAAVLVFGFANIMTAVDKTSPAVSAFLKETDTRCDSCLKQFEKEGIRCTHESKDRICVALSNYYCLANCTVNLK
jgi:hypothetical protein